MRLIWATRGQTWGFRFLLDGGLEDPLPEYEAVFAMADNQWEVCHRVGFRVALRFQDPEGRKDEAGRVIPHEFVVFEPLASRIDRIEDGLEHVWPLVAETFDQVWDQPVPDLPPDWFAMTH